MKEEWLLQGATVPVDVETTSKLIAEIKRLIHVVGGMALEISKQGALLERQTARIVELEIEQDCVGWFGYDTGLRLWFEANKGDDGAIPLYKDLPQRPWVGLTDEEIKAFDTWHDNREEEVGWCNPSEIVAYIEAKLKEKNT